MWHHGSSLGLQRPRSISKARPPSLRSSSTLGPRVERQAAGFRPGAPSGSEPAGGGPRALGLPLSRPLPGQETTVKAWAGRRPCPGPRRAPGFCGPRAPLGSGPAHSQQWPLWFCCPLCHSQRPLQCQPPGGHVVISRLRTLDLIPLTPSLPPCEATLLQVPGIRTGMALGPFLPTQSDRKQEDNHKVTGGRGQDSNPR